MDYRAASLLTTDLSCFRVFESAAIEWDAGFNILSGPNASGKTSLLEAVYLLATGRVLRPGRDADVVRHGSTHAEVRGTLSHARCDVVVRVAHGSRKAVLLNGMKLPRASDLLGRLPAVCISSLDMELVRGEPSHRRMFLDLELCQLYPAYLNHLTQYKRSLEHRSFLLRRAQDSFVPECEFEVWEHRMAEHGAPLRSARRQFVSAISRYTRDVHANMGSGESLSLVYVQKDDAETPEQIEAQLHSGRSEDVARGQSLTGPHRDDLSVLIEGNDARCFGSQGQQRTAVVALKLATLEHAAHLGLRPLLLLDDMLSDLDETRRFRLAQWVLERDGQVILTCTEAAAVGVSLLSRARVFRVESGKVCPV